jgi:hypothetical protein
VSLIKGGKCSELNGPRDIAHPKSKQFPEGARVQNQSRFALGERTDGVPPGAEGLQRDGKARKLERKLQADMVTERRVRNHRANMLMKRTWSR